MAQLVLVPFIVFRLARLLPTGHISSVNGRRVGGRGESWGGSGKFYFREKGWAKRDFHDGWG